MLMRPPGQYAETMTEIRAKIQLTEVGIMSHPHGARTGALIIEIPGSENGPKADAGLAALMKDTLKDHEGVRVSHPIPRRLESAG